MVSCLSDLFDSLTADLEEEIRALKAKTAEYEKDDTDDHCSPHQRVSAQMIIVL